MATCGLYEIVKIDWGEPPGLPKIFIEEATSSLWTGEPPQKRLAPIRVRPSADGSIALLVADPLTRSGLAPQVLRVVAKDVAQRLALESPMSDSLQWLILDFAMDGEGSVYLLELMSTSQTNFTVLRKIAASGVELWRRSGPWRANLDLERLEGDFWRLLVGNGATVYLSATRHRGLVAKIDPENGGLSVYADWGEWIGEALVGPDEQIYYSRLAPERNTRAWIRYEAKTRQESRTLCDPEASELLAAPIGVDAEGRAYGVHSATIGCVGRQGTVLWREDSEAVALRLPEVVGEEQDLLVEPARVWKVDRSGTVYLPVLGPSAFHLVALTSPMG